MEEQKQKFEQPTGIGSEYQPVSITEKEIVKHNINSKLKVAILIVISIIVLLVVVNFALRFFTSFYGESYAETTRKYDLLSVADNSFTEQMVDTIFNSKSVEGLKDYEKVVFIGTIPTQKGRAFFIEGPVGYGYTGTTVGINLVDKMYEFKSADRAMDAGVGVYNARGEFIDACWSGWTRTGAFCDFMSEQKANYNNQDVELVKSVWRDYLNKHDFKEGDIASIDDYWDIIYAEQEQKKLPSPKVGWIVFSSSKDPLSFRYPDKWAMRTSSEDTNKIVGYKEYVFDPNNNSELYRIRIYDSLSDLPSWDNQLSLEEWIKDREDSVFFYKKTESLGQETYQGYWPSEYARYVFFTEHEGKIYNLVLDWQLPDTLSANNETNDPILGEDVQGFIDSFVFVDSE